MMIDHVLSQPTPSLPADAEHYSVNDLSIAYQAPKRAVHRVLLHTTGTSDSGYDSIAVIREDHIGSFGFSDVGVHLYINRKGQIEWGRSLEKTPVYPRNCQADDVVILLHGCDTSLQQAALQTLRALLPVMNAAHGNRLIFKGLPLHHARLGIGRDGMMIQPALQTPLS